MHEDLLHGWRLLSRARPIMSGTSVVAGYGLWLCRTLSPAKTLSGAILYSLLP